MTQIRFHELDIDIFLLHHERLRYTYMPHPNPHPCDRVLHTVYPKKYAHGFVVLCFVVVMQSFIMNSHEVFIHIHQGCFAGTGAIVRLPQCQWSKPDGYGKISQCITTTKHSKAKNVCIFLGIYCMLHIPLLDMNFQKYIESKELILKFIPTLWLLYTLFWRDYSRSYEIGYYNDRIASEVPVEIKGDWKNLNPNLAASRLLEILR